ncbi:hypothetical protein Bca52824_024428 [Brassica carinata]|uniref:DUF4283 domain-containing protein n=1 Tax=Brassica carinata TaxID=52824 RepID=A0A8X7VK98_BRACI|nr:hypothetical protein Bca52824_024428 [Brassica carinata]
MQEIDLGVHEAPIALPAAICAQAMPRLWGLADEVVGRIVEPTKFQFVFRSEEALNLVLRRGPWSFSEWMLVTRRWDATLTPTDLKIIPFGCKLEASLHSSSTARWWSSLMIVLLIVLVRFVILSLMKWRLWNFCVKCRMLTHESKDYLQHDPEEGMPDPLTDPPDPEGNGNAEQIAPPEAPVPDADTHAASVTGMAFPKEKAGMKDGSGSSSATDECKSAIPHFDVDMAAESIRYIKAKLAKGKFLKGELHDDPVHIPGLDHIQTKVKENEFTVMSPDWPVTQHYETYYHPMEPRVPEEEYMSGFDEYVKEEEAFFVKKRKRMDVVDWDVEDSPTNRLDLFPGFKKEKIESIDSCSGNDYDGGAGGPDTPIVSMKIISWNCQALCAPLTKDRLKELCFKVSPDILFLIETMNKNDVVRDVVVSLGFDYTCLVPPRGRSGGLAV